MHERSWTRRRALSTAALAVALVRPARATPEERDDAIRAFAGNAVLQAGRVKLDLPPLVENGNAAPLSVQVDSPMTDTDHVVRIGIFNERNPQPHVATFRLTPLAGRAAVSTRIRLATSQRITAVAELSDGTFWSDSAEVIVTLAACVEGS